MRTRDQFKIRLNWVGVHGASVLHYYLIVDKL